MIVYPAIDLRGGKVVRLKEGDPNRQRVFSDDPVATAQSWHDQGAEWVHMVNLDGAFSAENNNLSILEEVARLPVKVQFGGGLRAMHDIEKALSLGASRVVLGTFAIEQPEEAVNAVKAFGEDRIAIALDARHGKITTHGWQQVTEFTPVDFGRRMADAGVVHALYTDVHRDGSLIGVNVRETIHLAVETGLQVIASGGVGMIDEVHQLAHSKAIAGVVIGMALYEGKLTLTEALIAARDQHVG
ncbi:MAG: 1-(5-phosphoribosyl)-5-[(5-phosphoribosylamino) methylideneamino]imidazole-4-carboxamide isomerase [Anaerolineae bacterium]